MLCNCPDCENPVTPGRIVCEKHWKGLPRETQARVESLLHYAARVDLALDLVWIPYLNGQRRPAL